MQNLKQGKNKVAPSDKLFSIVGIGASAGGMEAVRELLDNLSPETGMAFVYIQHLDPKYESNLTEILARSTQMKVVTAEDNEIVKPNHLYVLPPNKEVSVIGEMLKLTERPPKPVIDLPVNFLFLSMAEQLKERAIGIVLSGMASDGSIGLKAIKQAGGITFAQDGSAKYGSMPQSAIAEGGVDFICSPQNIAKELERISKTQYLYASQVLEEGPIENSEEDAEKEYMKDAELAGILQILKNVNGVDFTHYKKNTINRRILRRMVLLKLENLKDYIKVLKQNNNEVQNLYNDLLINVTHFFRDQEAVDYIKKNILPKILKTKTANDPLRIWIPACSTGEEVYSLAILINEVLGDNISSLPVQIFGTDLSEIAITKARTAIYTVSDLQNMSPERIARFFVKVDGHYRVNKMIRDICVFAPHNLFKDPPFSRVDLISCCNVLIYLDNVLQRKIMANFHYALNKSGYLVLGQSETVGTSLQYFTQVDKKVKIYSKKPEVASKAIFDMNMNFPAREVKIPRKTDKPSVTDVGNNLNLERMVDKVFLTEFSPSAVVVNHDLDILQFRGSTSLYLEPSPGMASLNLLKMARSGLAFELRNGASKVIKSGENYKKEGIEISYQGQLHVVRFNIIPLEINAHEKLLLIVFNEQGQAPVMGKKGQYSRDRRVKQLENELLSLRDDMRTIVEDQEAANEELQSANEEIVSSNEELQSINEELETSKEEIESSNEELMTINQELLTRNDQLAEAHEYTASVVATIREAVIILDGSYRIKVANNAFYQTFLTKERETEGVIIYKLNNENWNIPELRDLLENQLHRNSHFHGLELTHTFKNVGEKVLMINCKKIIQNINKQKLYLLAIEDITEHRQVEKLLSEREAWMRNMADNVPIMIWQATPDKNFTYLNKTWLEFTGRTLATQTGIGWTESIHKDDIQHCLTTYHEAFDNRLPFSIEYRMKRHDGQFRWIINSAVPAYDSNHNFSGYIGSVVEIHDKVLLKDELEQEIKLRTQQLEEVNIDLEKSNNDLQQFAYIASHDLQEPLRKIITFANRLTEKFPQLLTEGSKEYLDKINLAANRMSELIDGLLNFSKANKQAASMASTNLNTVISNVITDLELVIQDNNAKIKIDQLPVIEAFTLQMNQLFYNLVSNALKFKKPGESPQITIACKEMSKSEIQTYPRLNAQSSYYHITVQDLGIGFSMDYAEQIFVIFQRLNQRHQYAGTGIGLALCKKIVENHGGEIFATSEEGNGAVFNVILPAKQLHQ